MKLSLVFGSALCALAVGCAAPADSDAEAASVDLVTSPGWVNSVSPNAKPNSRYMKERSYDALRQVGGLNPLQVKILERIRAYYTATGTSFQFGTKALFFAEAPERWATFLPEEQAAFRSLWALLELPEAEDPDMVEPVLLPLAGVTKLVQPPATRYDEDRRVPVASLAPNLQELALRVVNDPGTNAATISYAEVDRAIRQSDHYTPSEQRTFGRLLHAIELLTIDPMTFPRIELLRPLEEQKDAAIGGSTMRINRRTSKSCGSAAIITSSVGLSFNPESGVSITWTPLNEAGRLKYGAAEIELVSPTTNYLLGQGRGFAVAEAWKSGQRIGQKIVVVGANETISLDAAAIVENGKFVMTPFETTWGTDATMALDSVQHLPAGRYALPPTAMMDAYGLGVYRVVSNTTTVWTATPAPSASNPGRSICFDISQSDGLDLSLTFRDGKVKKGLNCGWSDETAGEPLFTLDADSRVP